jgi:hypothetical protein
VDIFPNSLFPQMRDKASRDIGFEIGKELNEKGRCSWNKRGRIPVVIYGVIE